MIQLKSIAHSAAMLCVFAPAIANALPFALDLSIAPQSPGPAQEIIVDAVFSSEGAVLFAVGTTFSTIIDILGSDIVISIAVIPRPPPPPGTFTSPSFSLFDSSFSLGLLPVGAYSLSVFLSDTAQVVGSGSTTFTVIPEPSVGTLLALGLFWLGFCCRRTALGALAPSV